MDLPAPTFDAVTLLPVTADRTCRYGFRFGGYASDGTSIADFDHPWLVHQPPGQPAPPRPGVHIYGGALMDHFGHMLLEGLSRLWFIRRHPDLSVLWHWIDLPVPHGAWPGWGRHLWELLGLHRHRHTIIRGPMTVERVIVPAKGLLPPDRLHPLQSAALAVEAGASPWAGRRVWLSRSALPRQFGRLHGEAAVEQALRAAGWAIVHPEQTPIAQQAATFNDAAAVAGFAGSAFHAVLLAASPRAKLRIVRRPSVQDGYYEAAAQAHGLDQRYIDPPLHPHGPVNAWSSFTLTDPAALAATVDASLDASNV